MEAVCAFKTPGKGHRKGAGVTGEIGRKYRQRDLSSCIDGKVKGAERAGGLGKGWVKNQRMRVKGQVV